MSAVSKILNQVLTWYYNKYGNFLSYKETDLLVFGARNGMHYMDNSRALYEWYIKNKPEQPVIWLTRSREVLETLKSKNYPVASFYSHQGIKALYRARFGFYTNRAIDLAAEEGMLPKDLRLIFLSHGQSVKNSRLTVKKGLSEEFRKDIEKSGSQVYRAITSSHWMGSIQAKSQGLDPAKYIATGFPRNDWMLEIPEQEQHAWDSFIGDQKPAFTILYAPTWRMHGEPTRLFPFEDLDVKALASYLQKHNVLLLLRPHIQELDLPINKELVQRLTAATSNVRLATNKEFPDANALLPFTDMLVSDYSSIYHDYLLLDRPIALIPYDYDHFESQNGFKYPYMDNLPGPLTLSQKDFLDAIGQAIAGKDEFASQREQLRKKIYQDLDGSACERVAAAVAKL